jgi:CRISPR-associated protein Csb1
MTQTLTLDVVKQAVAGSAAAFRRVVELQPAGGPGTKVFPPTYMKGNESGAYAAEKRRINGEVVDCVLLDSVQSQANRMEMALLEVWQRKEITMPMLVVDFSKSVVPEVGQITSLETPHRLADAILRDSELNGTPFRDSELGSRLNTMSNRNALVLFELCPTALIFGMWDSMSRRGGLGVKFARALVSEIVGIGEVTGVRGSIRVDPLQISKKTDLTVYRTEGRELTLDPKKGIKDKNNKPQEFRPSEIGHGSIPAGIDKGGVTLQSAIQTTVLSLPALRRLHFTAEKTRQTLVVNNAARTVLAALGLCAATLASEQGYDLRSRCQLVPTAALTWELLGKPGEAAMSYALSVDEAMKILNDAAAEAKSVGLPWNEKPVELTPKDDLAKLVKKSYELAASSGEGEE